MAERRKIERRPKCRRSEDHKGLSGARRIDLIFRIRANSEIIDAIAIDIANAAGRNARPIVSRCALDDHAFSGSHRRQICDQRERVGRGAPIHQICRAGVGARRVDPAAADEHVIKSVAVHIARSSHRIARPVIVPGAIKANVAFARQGRIHVKRRRPTANLAEKDKGLARIVAPNRTERTISPKRTNRKIVDAIAIQIADRVGRIAKIMRGVVHSTRAIVRAIDAGLRALKPEAIRAVERRDVQIVGERLGGNRLTKNHIGRAAVVHAIVVFAIGRHQNIVVAVVVDIASRGRVPPKLAATFLTADLKPIGAGDRGRINQAAGAGERLSAPHNIGRAGIRHAAVISRPANDQVVIAVVVEIARAAHRAAQKAIHLESVENNSVCAIKRRQI